MSVFLLFAVTKYVTSNDKMSPPEDTVCCSFGLKSYKFKALRQGTILRQGCCQWLLFALNEVVATILEKGSLSLGPCGKLDGHHFQNGGGSGNGGLDTSGCYNKDRQAKGDALEGDSLPPKIAVGCLKKKNQNKKGKYLSGSPDTINMKG